MPSEKRSIIANGIANSLRQNLPKTDAAPSLIYRIVHLLLDENASGRTFVSRLLSASYNVETSIALDGPGAADVTIFETAITSNRALVTYDCSDFRTLYATASWHSGLLLIYGNGLATDVLVRAIDRVAELYPILDDLVLSLNDFRW
jgi:predicted nuclease of predicted toxin-antitoxin system